MRTLTGLSLIAAFLAAGDLLHAAGVPIPGSVSGMVLLAAALQLRLVRSEWVRPVAEFLADNLPLLFVPAGVGITAYFGLIGKEWLPVCLSLVGSTLVVMLFAGGIERGFATLLERARRRRE